MKTIIKYLFGFFLLLIITLTGCSDTLDEKPDGIFTDEEIFSDINMIKSALANFYGRVNWGQHLDNNGDYAYLDEAAFSNGKPNELREYHDSWWRVYDYGLIRDLNIFLHGLDSEAAQKNPELDDEEKKELEGEIRFLRAWTYFNICKGLGGVPIIHDEVFDFDPSNPDVISLQKPRATEAGTYEYIMSECDEIADKLLNNSKNNDYLNNKHAARANKWAALALKARAALYAGSIAKYNNIVTPEIVLDGGELGIPASRAAEFYNIAYTTAKEIMNNGPYTLYTKNPDKGRNFYDALVSKESNPEVIWALDYISPGKTNGFTKENIATSVKPDVDANIVTPILNIVEAFEYTDDRNGKLKTTDENGEYIYYDKLEDLFKEKDARLEGTIITPGSTFRSTYMTYQAGQKYLENGKLVNRTGDPGKEVGNYGIVTDQNGPVINDEQFLNKTGFNIRKFVDENPDAATRGRGSDIWFVRFRYAEVILIAAEAALELNKPQSEVCEYINQIRDRAGIQPLTSVTIDDIIQENRVEFVYENHRWWDLKRWRRAHLVWDGKDNNESAVHYALFPYKINDPAHPQNGKFVFDKIVLSMSKYPRNFRMQNYYNFFDQGWLNNNPLLVKNKYQ